MSSVIYSNAFEKLYQSLKEELFQTSNPLKPKVIVVPSQKVKDWLQQRLMNDPDVGIAMGLQFMGVTNALEWLCPVQLMPHPLSMALETERAIYSVLEEPVDKSNKSLHEYFSNVQPGHPQFERRAERLADCLSQTFMLYERYGGVFFAKWRQKMGWVQKIWSLTAKGRPVLCDRIAESKMRSGIEVHLFNVGFMPALYLQFFEGVKAYQFSPCGVYWGDINKRSEKDNPLLAHWGRLGKWLSLNYDEYRWQVIDAHEEVDGTSTLSNVKRAIFHSFLEMNEVKDASVEIHTAVTRLREVEVVKECLIHLLSTRHAGIGPEQVAIYAPDIALYAPFIEHVFSDSPFPYVIYDLPLAAQSEWYQAMTALIDMAQSRLEPSDVINFFSMPCVQRGCDLTADDIRQLATWSEKGQVRWGYDQSTRDKQVALPEHTHPLLEQTDAGTWTFAFHGLINGLIAIEDEALDPSFYPLDFVEFSLAEILGKWMRLLKELNSAINIIESGELRSVEQWQSVFSKFDQTFFDASEHDKGYQAFFQNCNQCRAQGTFSFSSIWDRLKASLSSHTVNAHTHVQNGIQFASLKTGRTTSSSICWILGLHDGAYPRSNPKVNLNEMDEEADLMPTHSDEDRYLFLELLTSTQDQFIVSYVKRSETDGKEQGPCTLIDDLQAFCPNIEVIDHPEHPFDPQYFSNDFAYPSYQQANYEVASGMSAHRSECVLIPQFFGRAVQETKKIEEIEIDIAQIRQFAKNPLSYFIKQRLGVFLDYEEEKDQEFQLALLEKIRLRAQYQKLPLQRLIEQAQSKGRLPLGRFKELAIDTLNQEHKELQNRLHKFQIDESNLFTVQLDRHNVKPLYMGEQQWICPAIEVPLKDQTYYITGTLEGLTPQGMLVDGGLDIPGISKVWPLWLMAAIIANRDQLGNPALLTSTGMVATPSLDPMEDLKAYVMYFLRAQNEPSPLMPFWTESFLKDDPQSLEIAIGKSSSDATFAADPYVLWAMSYENHLDVDSLIKNWSGLAKEVFGGFYGSL